jgi:predicted CopG family antitoxin
MNEEVKTIQVDEEVYNKLAEFAEKEQISPEEAALKIILYQIEKIDPGT